MAQETRPLDVFFTPAARADLIAIWEWNAVEHGIRRADSYIAFLERKIVELSEKPALGQPVTEYPGVLRRLAKRRSRSHGHIIFYRVAGARLEVLHIYHTAQDWQSKIDAQEDA